MIKLILILILIFFLLEIRHKIPVAFHYAATAKHKRLKGTKIGLKKTVSVEIRLEFKVTEISGDLDSKL